MQEPRCRLMEPRNGGEAETNSKTQLEHDEDQCTAQDTDKKPRNKKPQGGPSKPQNFLPARGAAGGRAFFKTITISPQVGGGAAKTSRHFVLGLA